MSWIAAAFGISQLDRLGYYDKIRQRNANILIDELKNDFFHHHLSQLIQLTASTCLDFISM